MNIELVTEKENLDTSVWILTCLALPTQKVRW